MGPSLREEPHTPKGGASSVGRPLWGEFGGIERRLGARDSHSPPSPLPPLPSVSVIVSAHRDPQLSPLLLLRQQRHRRWPTWGTVCSSIPSLTLLEPQIFLLERTGVS